MQDKVKHAFIDFVTLPIAESLEKLETSQTDGLSKSEAGSRLSKYGKNTLKAQGKNWWTIFARQFKSPFIYLLITATAISFALGEALDGSMIILFVVINTSLGFYQEYKSEQIVKLLNKFTASRTKVLRSGTKEEIDSVELVPGDIVFLEAGDILQADVRFLETENFAINETILTGESVPSIKTQEPLVSSTQEIYKAANIGFAGTAVTSGKARGVVIATAGNTVLGTIGKLTAETEHISTFEKGMSQFSSFILKLTVVTLILLFITNMLLQGSKQEIFQLLIFSIALAVSVIPEALPVVTTFSLSRGAMKLAKHNVVVKRLSAIEDLGSIEVLCTDKTGTITENKLTVKDYWPENHGDTVLSSRLAATTLDESEEKQDSFDRAIAEVLTDKDLKALKSIEILEELPFDPIRKRNTVLYKEGNKLYLVSRGAPEEIAKLTTKTSIQFQKWVDEEGKKGNRVLAVARKEIEKRGKLTELEKDMDFLGILSFFDPLKESTAKAVKDAQKLGIQVKILTGDSAAVAEFVGREIGLLENFQHVLLGEEIDKLTEEKLLEAVTNHHIFARVSPEQKYKIIKALSQKYEVGFLGEGINDAPALQASNVAIVVQSASDISRNSADIVLLDKSLDVIVGGIQEGREVFANTIKYIKITLASNFGNFYAIAVASLLINFLPMLPLQILLINLLSDFPMIGVATDNVDDIELVKPNSYNVREIVIFATIMGLISTVFDFMFFGVFYRISPEVLHTNWFLGSILSEILMIFSVRTRFVFFKAKPLSKTLGFLAITAVAITYILPMTTFGQKAFQFVRPTPIYLLIGIAIVLGDVVVTEVAKVIYYRKVEKRITA